jgi:hypothetical protein
MTHPDPAFLAQLNHVHQTDDGYTAQCPVFGCHEKLRIEPDGWDWTFDCPEHPHHAVVSYLLCDTRVDKRPAIRAWLCLRLALTPDAWGGLMLGRNVNPAAIDQQELTSQRRSGMWP